MNKSDLVKALSVKMDSTQVKAKEVLEMVETTIYEALVSDKEVSVLGGKFVVEFKEATEARNPKTGEKVPVPAKNKVKFKAGKEIKDIVNQ